MMIKREGIVIKAIDYKESSRILYCITETGRINLMMHGAKKTNSHYRVLANPLTKVVFSAKDGSLVVPTDIEMKDYYASLKDDYQLNMYANYICGLVYSLPEDINFSLIYQMLDKALKFLSQQPPTIVLMFELKTLFFLGIQPNFKKCACCDSENVAGFSISHGSVLCQKHLAQDSYSRAIALILKALYYGNFADACALEPAVQQQIKGIIDRYYDEYAPIKKPIRRC